MKENLKNDKGNTLIELVMVMLLLVLFGVTIYTLIIAGSNTQQKIFDEKNAQVDARIALSYLNVKLRQFDAEEQIHIVPHPETGENAILISQKTEDGNFDTWIYYSEGRILEFFGDEGEVPNDDYANSIVNIQGFTTAYDEVSNSVTNTVLYDYSGVEKEMSSTINLKTKVSKAYSPTFGGLLCLVN